MNKEIGHIKYITTIKHERTCLLTIGSIIIFNGRKKIVTHTDLCQHGNEYFSSNRSYYRGADIKYPIDITLGFSGFLKDILTGEELRSNWSETPKKNILHFEHLDKVNL